MTRHCKYHPTQPAHWDCASCDKQYCNECVTERVVTTNGVKTGTMHLCPDCNSELLWIGASNVLEPFWTRLPKIFLYPFSAKPITVSLILSIVACLFSWFPFVRLIAYAVLIKYAFSILKTTMHGNLNPPDIETLFTTDDFTPVIKQWIMYILLAFSGFALLRFGYIGILLFYAYLIIISYSLPSMIMLLVTSESLAHALNPVMFLGFAYKIGKGYLIMWFFLLLLLSAPGTLGYYIIQYLPGFTQKFLINFGENMYTFITYHLMGYVILQYHENIGHEIEYEDFQENTRAGGQAAKKKLQEAQQAKEQAPEFEVDSQSNITGQAELLTREGKLDEALAYIKETTAESGIVSSVLLERYYNLLKMRKHTKEMVSHGLKYLNRLIKNNLKTKACQVYIDCATADKAFKPTARDLAKVGAWLNQENKVKASINAHSRLINFYPENRLVPKTYLLLAKIYNEKMNNKTKSKAILNILIKKFPDHDIITHAKQYIQQLE